MKEIFDYKGKEIELDYSEKYVESIKSPFKVWSVARGVLRKYERLEKKALIRLISYPIRKVRNYDLVAIKGLKRSAESIVLEGELGLELKLEGYAIFRKLNKK